MGNLVEYFALKKEQKLFDDITWMMPQVDVVSFCDKMGWKIHTDTGTHFVIKCPDHHLRTGREPSDPKCYIDKATGETHCKTEPFGSNLVFIMRRLLKCKTYTEAYQFIVGSDAVDQAGITWQALQRKLAKLNEEPFEIEGEGGLEKDEFQTIRFELQDRHMEQSGYDFFMYPPGKKPTLINKETVDFFKVFQWRYGGYYDSRVIVPSFSKNILTGYAAIDIIGKDAWVKNNPAFTEKAYKKVLYPKGMKTSQSLFNYDSCENGAEVIYLVEGVRDVMKLWQLGFKNVVALGGTSVSTQQIVLLSEKYPSKLIVIMDGDNAGYSAARKIADKINRMRVVDCFMACTPRYFDPKTLPQEGLEKAFKMARLAKT